MRPWIFGLVASFAIAGCSRGTGSEYYPPLKSGSQLRYVGQYTGTFGAVQRTEMVTRVEDEERINDHAYWRVVTVVTGMPDMTPQVTYARFDSAGMHLIDGAHRAFGEYLDVPFPVAVGTSWIVSRDRDTTLFSAVGIESVETLAKRFDDCLKIHFTSWGQSGAINGDSYRARGIGEVKVAMHIGNIPFEYTLASEK